MWRILVNLVSLLALLALLACNGKNNENAPAIQSSSASTVINDDFQKQNPAWKPYEGDWLFENGELKQNAEDNDYPVILREDKQFTNLDVSVSFKPISGDIDASGGIIFRAENEDNYYIVRANALEGNFRLYTFVDGRRHQLSSASVTPPSLNQYHQMRVVAKGDHIQAYLDGKLELDYHDTTFTKGYTGLWTKEDSVTMFDQFKVLSIK